MFTSRPTYDIFRTLKLTDPFQRGEDVYALQTAIVGLGVDVDTDGILGPATSKAIKTVQDKLNITVDGLAGGGTQTAIVRREANAARGNHNLPVGLTFGQISHESSCRLGIYTPTYADGSWDVGATQRNSALYDIKESFTVPFVIDFLGAYERSYYDKFAGVKDTARRWALAAGAWNRPAYAGWIANEEGAHVPRSNTKQPTTAQRVSLEAYMASATAFLEL